MEFWDLGSGEREETGNMVKKTVSSGSLEFFWEKMYEGSDSDIVITAYDYSNQTVKQNQ